MWTGSVDVTDDLELVSPGPDEVLVRIVSAGVCHSDLSVIDGTIQFPTPAVLGHEGAGIVEGVGSSVTLVKPGDHVVLITMEYCGACAQCDAGRPTLCLNQTNRIINNRPFTYKGEAAYAFANTGVVYSFECVGRPALIRQTIDMLAPGGTCVVIGTTPLGSEVAFDVRNITLDKTIMGCRYGTAKPHRDIPLFVDLYRSGCLKLDELVTRTYPMEDIDTVFADMKAGEVARGVLGIGTVQLRA